MSSRSNVVEETREVRIAFGRMSCRRELNPKLNGVGDESAALLILAVVKIGAGDWNFYADGTTARRKTPKRDFGGHVQMKITLDVEAK